MNELRTIYMIGNHDSPETFFEAERKLISRGYKPLNPVKFVREYEGRFGTMGQSERRKKLLGHLLRADGVMLLPGWTASVDASVERKVSTFCGKATVKILLTGKDA